MKTSWTETAAIEAYLAGQCALEEQLLFEARLLIDEQLREKTAWQLQSHELIRNYSRKKIMQEIQNVHQQLFADNSKNAFRKGIFRIFSGD